MDEEVVCCYCGRVMTPFSEWRCSNCGGVGEVIYQVEFSSKNVEKNRAGMWRYVRMLPPSTRHRPVSLGEGGTPVVRGAFANILMKLEYVSPTGSFKDRGSATALTSMRNIVGDVRGICEDSSGNAGASLAAYSAAAGLECVVFAGENIVAEKALQVKAYGAELRLVKGPREEVSAAAQKEAGRRGFVYIGHVWNPYFIEGMKTVAYEIAEQTSWNPPDRIYLPVSAGTLLLGLIKGFRELVASGVVEKIPKIVAVQPAANPPLYKAFKDVETVEGEGRSTVADALTLRNPPRLRQMVEALKTSGGDVEIVTDEEILVAQRQMGFAGVYAEPSSAVAYAAVRRSLDEFIARDEHVMVIVTGFGAKSSQHLQVLDV
jgi:threonine synthase